MSAPANWREIAQEYFCEVCLAEPGQPCRTVNGIKKYEVHTSRSQQASMNGWRDPNE